MNMRWVSFMDAASLIHEGVPINRRQRACSRGMSEREQARWPTKYGVFRNAHEVDLRGSLPALTLHVVPWLSRRKCDQRPVITGADYLAAAEHQRAEVAGAICSVDERHDVTP